MAKTQKFSNRMDKEDYALDQAVSFFRSKAVCKMEDEAEDVFGKNVAPSLKKINDDSIREFTKLKIQELLYQARCRGLLSPQASMSMHQQ